MKTVQLTRGYVALVDDADYGAVSQFKWRAMKIGRRVYAVRSLPISKGKRANQYLHQFLFPEAFEVHHLDGNGLNNQRFNLQPSTRKQNAWGFCRKKPGATSKYRGVTWNEQCEKWQAAIKVNYKAIYLGLFKKEEDAARARDTATLKYYGPDAQFNFPL